jgi:hypothetical protein
MCDPAKHLLTFGVDDPHGHHRYTTTNGSASRPARLEAVQLIPA